MEVLMLQDVETNVITISPEAASAVRDIMIDKKLDGYALRVFVAGSGCCSIQFGMALDNKIGQNDIKLESNGVNLIVDEMSIDYLRGGKIDFINDPQHGQGFIIDSPSAKKETQSCGCGSHSHESSDKQSGSCACGGSCGCN
jgi:iron-sulfur cluster assembly accessory protein